MNRPPLAPKASIIPIDQYPFKFSLETSPHILAVIEKNAITSLKIFRNHLPDAKNRSNHYHQVRIAGDSVEAQSAILAHGQGSATRRIIGSEPVE